MIANNFSKEIKRGRMDQLTCGELSMEYSVPY